MTRDSKKTAAQSGADPSNSATKIPLLDLAAQLREIGPEIKHAVEEVIDSTRYILGPNVETLEQRIAEYVGARFGIGVTSGTDALLISLTALDVGPGDLVLTTAYSFFATAGVVARLRATPVFVDIDPDTYNISPGSLRDWFRKHPDSAKQVKAIIPVHLYGQCADMDPILEIARGVRCGGGRGCGPGDRGEISGGRGSQNRRLDGSVGLFLVLPK